MIKEKTEIYLPYRRHILLLYIVLVLIWSAGGILAKTGALSPIMSEAGRIGRIAIYGPFGFLTWPAHQVSLVLASIGAGANALSPITISTFAAFLVWSCILWSPVLTLHWRETPLWIGIPCQILFLLAVFAIYWKLGNG